MKTRTLTLSGPGPLRLAVCADFHSAYRPMPVEKAIARLGDVRPDLILGPGDFFNYSDEIAVDDFSNRNALAFLRGAAAIAPVYYSTGNHDRGLSPENRRILEDAGVHPLLNEFVHVGALVIGGLSSTGPVGRHRLRPEDLPDCGTFLDDFAREPGFHILLCHHPEYWEPLVRDRGIELTAAGHAHGGQWRLFGRGIYAPGQGLFPRYTSGLYASGSSEILAVSRGMTNSMPLIPRFFNPTEILVLEIVPEA
ncbi:MAG: metallophosphoesterase [Clostridia bacterium]|nr:metallophosphoesterase [Clostridia bacterium]